MQYDYGVESLLKVSVALVLALETRDLLHHWQSGEDAENSNMSHPVVFTQACDPIK